MKFLAYISVVFLISFVFFNYINVYLNFQSHAKITRILIIGVFIAISMLALYTKPDVLDDLSRHFSHIDNFRTYGLAYLNTFPYTLELITTSLFYLVSLTPINNLLPLIVVLTFYYALYMCLKEHITTKNTYLFSLFIIVFVSYVYIYQTISGVRFPLSIALFLIVFSKDKQESSFYWLLYFLPLLTHISSSVLVVIVLFSKLGNKVKISFGPLFLIFPYLCLIISKFVPENIPYISTILEKMRIYSNPEFYLAHLDWRVQICIIFLIVLIVILYVFYRKGRKINSFQECFYENLLMIVVGLLPFPLIGNRYFVVLLILSIPYFMNLNNFKYKYIIIFFLVFLSFGLLLFRFVNAFNYWRFY